MTISGLTLYYHPFSSFCQKALMALYENDVPFERRIIDLGDTEQRAELARLWPMTKFPVLRDNARNVTVPEATLIIQYLELHHPGPAPLLPADPEAALAVHLWDRVFDNYVEFPLQKIVADTFRPEGRSDPEGVAQARGLLATTYKMLNQELAHGGWIAGESFSLADCGAAPALFYSNIVLPFTEHANLAAYYQRLLARTSFARCVEEARPYRTLFPLPWPAGYE
jgi:glutathione S-transferase